MPGVFDTSFSYVRNAFPLFSAYPILVSARVSTFGMRLSLAFNQPVTGDTPPILAMSGGAVTATYLSGSGTSTLVFELSRTVETSETGTLSIAADDYEAVAGWLNLSQSGVPVLFAIPPVASGSGASQFELVSELVSELTSELIGRRGGAGHGIDGYYAFDPAGEVELGDDVDLVFTDFSVEGEFEFDPASPEFGDNVDLVWTETSLTYQHYKDGVAIDDATSATLSLTNVGESDNGSYTIRVTNPVTGKSRTFGPLAVGVSGVSGPVQGTATGGTITEVGGYKIHTFTSSGDFVVESDLYSWEILRVAGGGGGGQRSNSGGGGGGAGGYVTTLGSPSVTPLVVGTYPVVIGAGGAGAVSSGFNGSKGSDTSFNAINAIGGGGGGGQRTGTSGTAGSGGSGGGALGVTIGDTLNPGSGTVGQGNDGGQSFLSSTTTLRAGGGGGGAGAVGGNASSATGGNGGAGLSNSISGSAVTYAVGGQGANNGSTLVNGADNTGNGGTGGYSANGGNGGSGVFILRYPIAL